MKPVGHLRRAWISLQDGCAELEAAAAMTRDAGVDEIDDTRPPARAARRIRQAIEWVRPVLKAAESAPDNDSGLTPLELARDAKGAHAWFLYCFEKLGTISDGANGVWVKPPTEEMRTVTTLLDRIVAILEERAP